MGQHRSCQRYVGVRGDDAGVRMRIRDLAAARPRYGYRRIHVLLSREGIRIGHRRLRRLYLEEGLVLRSKRRPKRASHVRVPLTAPSAPGKQWCMDFMYDQLSSGRAFRTFNVLDVFSRQCLAVVAKHSFSSADVTAVLDALVAMHGKPEAITCDNGSEFASRHFDAWAYQNAIAIDFIMPGKPAQNGYIESFNGRLREECLSASWFESLDEAQRALAAWVRDYNEVRPHSALSNLAPLEYIARITQASVATLVSA